MFSLQFVDSVDENPVRRLVACPSFGAGFLPRLDKQGHELRFRVVVDCLESITRHQRSFECFGLEGELIDDGADEPNCVPGLREVSRAKEATTDHDSARGAVNDSQVEDVAYRVGDCALA